MQWISSFLNTSLSSLVFSDDSMKTTATEGQLQLYRRGTEICTENKLFWNPREKWLTQVEKDVYGRLPARGIKGNVDRSQGKKERAF